MLTKCDSPSIFDHNQALYASQGVVFNPNGDCVKAQGLSLIGNNVGITMNPIGVKRITFSNIILSDNVRGINTRVAMAGINPVFIYDKVKVKAFSRSTKILCPYNAMTFLITSMNAESMPLRVIPTPAFTVQCMGSPFEGRLAIKNMMIQDYSDS